MPVGYPVYSTLGFQKFRITVPPEHEYDMMSWQLPLVHPR